MALTRVLITVKTYPNIYVKYDELLCIAGIKSDGSWIRIYPILFRKLSYSSQYKRYDWFDTLILIDFLQLIILKWIIIF
jgi:hypothetical protein